MVALLAASIGIQAAEVVYRIVEYNKTTAEFTLEASGLVPRGAWAYFLNDYGATSGNRYNQIPRNRTAALCLEGWQGCTVKSITLSMCSNNKSGSVGLSLNDGDTQIYKMRPADFASDEWFGQWVSKDLGVYVDITKRLDVPALLSDEADITLQGGTSEGSVYVNAITIEYDEAPGTELESPLGWSYEKLTRKSTIAEGDELMIFRNGCAAADLGGMQESHYLDVVTIASTADVATPDMLRFRLGKGETEGLWTMTDQHGRMLGATGKQALAWNEGTTQWNIAVGYDGAEITNAKAGCGTLRYNAPAESYARFNVYTSTSLPLPFLYRKDKQRDPVVSNSLSFGETSITADLQDAHIALKPTIAPKSATDKRIEWSSSNETVATVNGGFVTLLAAGETIITARTKDGGAQASVSLAVTDYTTGINAAANANGKLQGVRKTANGNSIVIVTAAGKRFAADGKQM